MSSNIRLYGHVYDGLEEYRGSEETRGDALDRLLPDEAEVIEYPEEDVQYIHVSESIHEQLKESAGENVAISEVVEYYLRREDMLVVEELSEGNKSRAYATKRITKNE